MFPLIKIRKRKHVIGKRCKEAMTRLASIEDLHAKRTPFKKLNGIYFLFNGDELVYVGLSVNIIARVHVHDKVDWDSYSFVEVDIWGEDLEVLETAYIKKFKPRYNSLPAWKLKNYGMAD
jgi:excinuclease UvrABC nuclease subunit